MGPYVVAGLFSPWRGGFGVAETSRRSEPRYGVRGARTTVVRRGLSPRVHGFEQVSSRSRDLDAFRNAGLVSG